jgi:RAP1 GTPase activating protein 1
MRPIILLKIAAHTNLLAFESVKGPLAVSIIKNGPTYKILVRSSKVIPTLLPEAVEQIQGSERMVVQYPLVVSQSFFRKLFALGPTMREVLLAASPTLPVISLEKCKDTNLPNELLAMEERQVIRSYKFGLCYLSAGQSTEQEMFQNRLGVYT